MQRYFIDGSLNNDMAAIVGDDCHHISRVMRMGKGSQVICSDQNGKSAVCVIEEITDEKVMVNVVEWIEATNELPVRVTIASGLPKGDKLELIIQKGTELGAFEFIPFIASRSIVKWDEKKALKKVERWQKIAKEAAEQSHRSILPAVHSPVKLETLTRLAESYDFKLIAYEEEAKAGEASMLFQTLNELKAGDSLFVVFGPEGGLSDKEIAALTARNFKSCGLGPRILRTETAPLYTLSAISYHTELMR
ncbi:16S rRNA (uracil(1498)-N(3))-methyltransferase [Mesobacillus harenae]|uniref:16S rRNA (uracil(1498)-N(3))-methyltransferase n=1 Tax=Mesobacillus harenae TaxID=2213203 RepID=UPI001580A42C|nr:16S rRNA (uracil(1498)-N(3))-methyltransferase [Mesobacillus harenae]